MTDQQRSFEVMLLALPVLSLVLMGTGCARKSVAAAAPAQAFGAAIVESSGGKQIGATGAALAQPVVVQVNDEQNNTVTGATVLFSGPAGVSFDPPSGVTDSSGQFSTVVTLGEMAGRYQIVASTITNSQKPVTVKLEEIALDYQRRLGQILDDKYCSRCHNPESTPERVSNYDNLEVKPHAFTEGETLNKLSDGDLMAIIGHGGPALNKSPLMPPYGYTLSKTEIQALIAYIRMVSDPPYQAPGMIYVQK
jgi:mono/diheme cytochrome c family protein